jgi:hypothetical protein|tara:strand:+ start:839 stop:1369 length:531 start_codon:yes stop_codon:yes gene_type:complete
MKKSLTILLSLSLFSCANQSLQRWPDTIPQQAYFAAVYAADEANRERQTRDEYLQWIMNFYEGSLVYSRGWLDVESAVLAASDPRGRSALDSQLADLGAAIAAEWAKDNDLRIIDNRMLSLWGWILQLADSNEQRLLSVEIIQLDVANLLEGDLVPTEVTEPRYERLLEIELFDDF